MIAVELKGGMSNQLFQYATARRLAHVHNTDIQLDISWFDNIATEDTQRHYELDNFKVTGRLVQRSELRINSQGGRKNRLKKIFQRNSSTGLTVFQEKGFQFQPAVLNLPNNTYLEGYFQSEKYFKDIRNILLKDLAYQQNPSDVNKKLLDKIRATEAVSVHVRRGDYVNNSQANKFHGLVSHDYYTAAVELIKKRLKNPVFYVISNDPDWCKSHLKLAAKTVYVSNNDDLKQGAEDMRLMRTCQHNIIANSSFSWWGAWLNQNPHKIVIAPKGWFRDKSVNTSDLIPSSWQKI